MIAVGLFVAALVVVGILLLTNPDDDDDGQVGAAGTATASTTQSMLAPTGTLGTREATSAIQPEAATATGTGPQSTLSETNPSPQPTSASVEPSATPTDEPENDDPVVSPEPEESDESESTPTDEPDPELIVGEFGELPPAQIVSGGLARDVDLTYELGISLDIVPVAANAYRLYWAGWSAEEASSVASKVNISADVLGSGGNYEVIGDGGQLYISRTVVQYVSTRAAVGGLLEDNWTVIENARIWLANSGITAGNVGEGLLIGRDDAAQRAVVLFKPTSPSPLLAFYPSATVTIGPGGDVREANIRWPDGYDTSGYDMRPANQIWNDVLAGEGSIDADLSDVPGSGPVAGTFTAYDVSIAYSFAVAGDGNEYLVPLIVFSGEIYLSEYDMSIPATVYIQGVYGQSAPRG